jgi:hypothetical protein
MAAHASEPYPPHLPSAACAWERQETPGELRMAAPAFSFCNILRFAAEIAASGGFN